MKLQEIIDQLNEVFDGNPWYGNTITTCFRRLKEGDLTKSLGSGHSIGQLIEHMIAWRQLVIDKLKGNERNLEVNSQEDWQPKKELRLEELITKFEITQKDLVKLLSSKSDEFLATQVPGKDFPFEELLAGIIQHDIYHLGQLYLLQSSPKAD